MKISVLGDSVSTYAGFSNNVVGSDPWSNYYPNTQINDVNSVTKTWWWEAIRQLTGNTEANILVNDSIGGTCVAYYDEVIDNVNHLGSKWCMNNQARIDDLGDPSTSSVNHPDIIMFFGGFNDACQLNFNSNTFYNQYVETLRKMFNTYSNSITVLCITPFNCEVMSLNSQKYNEVCNKIAAAVNHFRTYGYDCKLVSLMDINLVYNNGADINSHPSESGMRQIADRVAYVQQYGYQ
ncbi:MAG: hypothetical protein E7259_09020 [Lachnospiraceae bacterium]|nr:hypothetical protein [Lachnospiraceae bacterium]